MRFSRSLVLIAVALAGCAREKKKSANPEITSSSDPVKNVAIATPEGGAEPACTEAATPIEVVPGVRIQRLYAPIASPVGIGDRCVTLVRIDPSRHRLRLFNAAALGGKNRRADAWAAEFGLLGVINASMYMPDGHSVGLMINGAAVNQPNDDHRHGGFVAFDPIRTGIPAVSAFGRECAAFDLSAIKNDYRVVFQNYRLLDCDAHPIRWKDPKVFSAAAIGIGKEGDFVFIHARTPYTMTDFATILALPALAMAQAMFVEGGPEASLYLHGGTTTVRAIGSYESAFRMSDDNVEYWEIPNVIGFSPL